MNDQELARAEVGMGVAQPPSPELPAEVIQPFAQTQAPEPSVTSGTTGLAPWHVNKYEWRRSARGNQYLAPQATYVSDVLDRAEVYTARIEARLGKDEYEEFEATAQGVLETIQREDAFDTAGAEGNSVRRYWLGRYILARKICGSMAVSAEHRTISEKAKPHGDVAKMQADTSSQGYYCADIAKRESWGNKALRFGHIVRSIADGEVIPTDGAALTALVEKRITSGKGVGLGDEAFEVGKKLQSPTPAPKPGAEAPTREELLTLCA